MKIYYICYNKQYYTKLYGWVDHKNFAERLTLNEAQSLTKIYSGARIIT